MPDFSGRKKFGDRFKVDPTNRNIPWRAYNGNATDLTTKSLITGFDADMDYEVTKQPLYYQDKNGEFRQIERSLALVREDTPDAPEKYIGIVSKGYNPLQNRDFARLFEAFSNSQYTELVSYGAMAEGRDTFALFGIKDGDFLIGKEMNHRYLMVYNRHAGNQALKIALVMLRAVCTNVMQHALATAEKKINLYHTQHLHDNTELVVNTMTEAGRFGDELIVAYKKMMSTPIKETDARNIFWQLADVPEETLINATVYKAALRMYDDLITIYETEAVNDGTFGTRYGVFQSVTAYANHMAGRNVRSQLMQPHSSRSQLMKRAYRLCK